MYGHMWGYGGDHPWMFLGWIWMGLLWLVPLFLLFVLVKYLFGRARPPSEAEPKAEKTPLDILKEAYARGDISREEYLQKREDIEK